MKAMQLVVRIAGALLAVLVVCVLGLWIASNRRDAGRMRGSIEIERTPDEIFAWMNEPEKLKQWVGWLSDVRPDSSSPREGIGHRETWIMDDPRMKQKLLVPGTITLWEPPNQMGVHVEAPAMFDGDVFYKLTDLGNGRTKVEQDARFHYLDRFAALLEPMVTPEAMRKMVDDMHRLKSKVEAMPYPPDSTDAAADSSGH
jgi:carbon monoxide dehydrogenase subunit G